jgi:hypothetical protein
MADVKEPDQEKQAEHIDEVAAEAVADFEQIAAEMGPEETTTAPGEAPPPPQVSTAEVLTGIYQPLAMILCPAWGLQPQELQMLAEAHAAALDQWFPNGIDLGPTANAVIVTAMIIAPRVGKPRKVQKARQQAGGGEHESGE